MQGRALRSDEGQHDDHSSDSPTSEPTERRRFQLTNLDGNNNKYYLVETWALPDGQIFFRATYGRVGSSPQIDEKVAPPPGSSARSARRPTRATRRWPSIAPW